MKKILMILIIFILIFPSASAYGENFSPDKEPPNIKESTPSQANRVNISDKMYNVDYIYKTQDGEAILTDYISTSKETRIIVPEEIEGYPVVGLAGTFSNCRNITEVILPNSITFIDKHSFRNCYDLKTISFSDSLKIIGEYAFRNCYNLQDIQFPDSLKVIGNYAFDSCDSLEEFVIPKGIENLGYDIVSGKNLKRITNQSNLEVDKKSFNKWGKENDFDTWFVTENSGEAAQIILPNSTIYYFPVYEESRKFSKVIDSIMKSLEEKGVSVSEVSTIDQALRYVENLLPKSEYPQVTYTISVPDYIDGPSGTRFCFQLPDDIKSKPGIFYVEILFPAMHFPNDGYLGSFAYHIPIWLISGQSTNHPNNNHGGFSSGIGHHERSNASLEKNDLISISKPNLYSGTWEKRGDKWKLKNINGTYANSQWAFLDKKWYLIDSDGFMVTGWKMVNGKWYWMEQNGEMITGWKWIGDKCYCFSGDGSLYIDTITPDGYKVNSMGEWIQ